MCDSHMRALIRPTVMVYYSTGLYRYTMLLLLLLLFVCRMDQHLLIKVADFGLSEDMYSRNYFRQGASSEDQAVVKLPIRWMALESLLDHVFTEKTDVV